MLVAAAEHAAARPLLRLVLSNQPIPAYCLGRPVVLHAPELGIHKTDFEDSVIRAAVRTLLKRGSDRITRLCSLLDAHLVISERSTCLRFFVP